MAAPVGIRVWLAASLIICAAVVVMALVKVACVVSGYERHLPPLNLSAEQQVRVKQEATLYHKLCAIRAGVRLHGKLPRVTVELCRLKYAVHVPFDISMSGN